MAEFDFNKMNSFLNGNKNSKSLDSKSFDIDKMDTFLKKSDPSLVNVGNEIRTVNLTSDDYLKQYQKEFKESEKSKGSLYNALFDGNIFAEKSFRDNSETYQKYLQALKNEKKKLPKNISQQFSDFVADVGNSSVDLITNIVKNPQDTIQNVSTGIKDGIQNATYSLNNAFDDFMSSITKKEYDNARSDDEFAILSKQAIYEEAKNKLGDNSKYTQQTKQSLDDTIKKIEDENNRIANLSDEQAKVYNIGQNVGGMLPSIAATMITGNPTVGRTLFFTKAQQDYTEQAKANGKKDLDARIYGLVMGGFETAIENIGFNPFDIGKPNFIKSMGGEAFEEFVMPYVDSAVKTVGFGEKYDLGSTTKEAVEGAIYGAVVGAIMDAGNMGIRSVDNLILNITSDKNITSSELKEAINDINAINPNYFDEKISKTTNDVNALIQEDLSKNNAKDNQNENIETLPKYSEMSENTTNTNVLENKYQYMPTNNEKVNNFNQTVSKYNFDSSQKTIDMVDTVNKVIQDKGYNVLFDDTIVNKLGNPVNAQIKTVDGEVEIRINPNSPRATEFLLTHEITHAIETDSMKKMISDYASKNTGFNEALESLKQAYGVEDVSSEVVADISGQLFGNQEFINSLSTQEPSIFKKIYNKIIELANKITGNSNEALFIKDLKNKWETAYRNTTTEQAVNNLNNDIQYQQAYSNKYGTYWNVETGKDIFKGKTRRELQKSAYNYILNGNNNFEVINDVIDGKTVKFIRISANEYTRGRNSQKLSNDEYNKKMRIAPSIDDLINNAEIKYNSPLTHQSSLFKDGFNNYQGKVRIDDTIFRYIVRVGKAKNDNIFYDVSLENLGIEKGTSGVPSTESTSLLKKQVPLTANNISQQDKSVKSDTLPKYSMQENANNTWQEHLEKNYKATGTRTNMQELRGDKLPTYSQNNSLESEVAINNIMPYTTQEKNNFMLSTKIKIATGLNDIKNFVKNSLNVKTTNESLYLGKISQKFAKEINQKIGVNIEGYNLSLKANNVKKIIKDHGNSETEAKRGQVAVNDSDFELISEIVGNNDDFYLSGVSEQGKPSITFVKEIGNKYTLVEFVSDKHHTLEVQTMYKHKKKNPATALHDNNPGLNTSETDSGTSSYEYDDSTKLSNSQIAQSSNDNNTQNIEKNTSNNKKILNPTEISKLTPENASTTPKLPTAKVTTGDGESSFYENITEKTKMLSDESRNIIGKENEVEFYKKVTNQESLDKAYDKLNTKGTDETLRWFNQKSENATDLDVAEGWILLKQYQDSGDYDSMVQVAKKMREIGTKAGQTVQAFNIMERLTPEGMVKYAQSELSEAYDKMVKNKTKEWIDKYKSDFDLTPNEVQFIIDTMQEVQQTKDGYDKKVKLAEIQKLMTDKLPPEQGAGIKSWMRISMLFNPKTQVRNVMGNAVIAPVNMVGDKIASVVDKAISKKTGVRTTGSTNLKNYASGFKTGLYQSYNDFKKGINTRNIEGNRFEISQGKSFDNKTKIGKSLNKVDSLLSFMLDAGDRGFYEASFTNSINNQLILNNTTEVTQEMIDIATQEALSRTWQDNNNYTKFVLNIRKGLNAIHVPGKKGYGLGDVLIPFAKTPANLTKAIIDYSPAGLVNTIISGVNLKRSLSNGQYNAQKQHQFVQNLGKATAGTMLYILGYALAKAGISSGESDEDKDVANFMKNTLGISSYSIKIGDKTFTYDWAQPVAAPFAMMSNLVQKQKENTNLFENITATLDTGLNVVFEQSFLSSLSNVLSESGQIGSKLTEQMLELPSRAIPTLSKQIADLIDGTQRQSFVYGKPLETALNKAKAKIPGLSQTLSPSVDTLGRDIQKYGGNNNIFNVFLNPANVNTKNISESAKEIYRVYKETGDSTVMPRQVAYYINTNGEKITLTNKERAEYQKISGQIIEDNVKQLLNNSYYKKMSDEDKASVLNEIVNYSYNKARKDVLGLKMSNTYNKVNEWIENGGEVYEYYANKEENNYSLENPQKYQLMTNIKVDYYDYNDYKKKVASIKETYSGTENTNKRKQEVFKYINSLNYNKQQKIILYNMLGGYSIKEYQNELFNYVNNLKLSKSEKETMWQALYGS